MNRLNYGQNNACDHKKIKIGYLNLALIFIILFDNKQILDSITTQKDQTVAQLIDDYSKTNNLFDGD